MAMNLSDRLAENTDILSWIPISSLRKLKRGYDQSQLLACAIGKELGIPVVPVLKKIRHTPPQSSLPFAAQRRANITGAYKVKNPGALTGKRILLIDDILTTGATSSECARVLLTTGVKEVYLATIAVASHNK